MIHVEGLCKSFLDYQRGWVSAVRDVSFDCRAGRDLRAARAQRRGQDDDACGSSAPCSGRPAAGPIVAGHDVVAEPQAVRSSIGYMSASTGIYDRMTAWELVEYFGRLYRIARATGSASGWRRSSTGSR